MGLLFVFAGAVTGILIAVLPIMSLRASRPSIFRGLVAILTSFTLLSAAIMAVRICFAEELISFATPAVLAFLFTVVVGALRMQ